MQGRNALRPCISPIPFFPLVIFFPWLRYIREVSIIKGGEMQQHEFILHDDSPGAALYRRYAPGIFAYLYRETSSREDAEDILLEVFLAALERENFLAACHSISVRDDA